MNIKKYCLAIIFTSVLTCLATPAQNTFIAFIAGFNLPSKMAITSNSLYGYVVDTASNSILVVDTNPESPSFNTLIAAPSLVGTFNHPTYIAITPDNKTAYVTDQTSQSVIVIDTNPASPTFNTILAAPSLIGAFTDPIGITITPNGLYAYVINGTSNNVNLIDINPASPTYNTVLSTPNLDGILNSPFSIVISNDGNYGYISNLTGSMTVIDTNPASPTFNTVVSAPGLSSVNPQPEGFGFTPNGQFAYVSDGSGTDVSWIDTNPSSPTFNTVLSAPNLTTAFNAPNDVAVILDGNYAYVSNFLGATGSVSSVSVIDTNPASTTYNSTIDTPGLVIPGTTRFLSLTAAPNGRFVYALDGFNNTVDVIYTGIVSAPLNFRGCKTKNIFLTQIDNINRLTWTAPIVGNPPVSYKIYRDAQLTQLVAAIPATAPLQYEDHNRIPYITYTYYIVAIDSEGTVSTPTSTAVTTYCS